MRAFKRIARFLAKKLNREVVMRLGSEPKRSEHINAWTDEVTMQWLISESEKRNWRLSQTIHWYLSKCAKESSTNRTYMSRELHNNEKSPSAVTDEPLCSTT